MDMLRRFSRRGIAVVVACAVWLSAALPARADVDTALVISVDVSSSVDAERYKLQMQGIAAALEDKSVLDAILNGANASILFTMLTWTDRPLVAIPWIRISNVAEAKAVAARIRALPQLPGDFTCVTRMMRYVSDKIVPQIPEKTSRVVVDVSGDGSENCNPEHTTASVRDELISQGVTVNGLPILEGREAATLEGWYRGNIMGGPGSFVVAAQGFEDFGRAIRQKFVIEVSGQTPPPPALMLQALRPELGPEYGPPHQVK